MSKKIEERLTAVEIELQDLRRELFGGNGMEGAIKELKDIFNNHLKHHMKESDRAFQIWSVVLEVVLMGLMTLLITKVW